MQFSLSGLMPSVLKPKTTKKAANPNHQKLVPGPGKKRHRKKSKDTAIGCTGVSINLRERLEAPHLINFNPYGAAVPSHDVSASCSLRCRHPISMGPSGLRLRRPSDRGDRRSARAAAVDPDKWVSDLIYKRYTETDSRPVSPTDVKSGKSQSQGSSKQSHGHTHGDGNGRKCRTPEPETKQCKFYQRRTLVLDLRRVKSFDLLHRARSRQGSTATDGEGDSISTLLGTATGTSSSLGADSESASGLNWYDDDYGYGADEEDSEVLSRSKTQASEKNPAAAATETQSKTGTGTGSRVVELQPRLRPRATATLKKNPSRLNLGLKSKGGNGSNGNRKLSRKELKSSSSITYERPTSPKLLEGLTLPPLHSSVLTLLGQRAPHSQGGGIGMGFGPKSQSPRSGSLRDGGVGLHSAGGRARKGQKLRRHNRKLKKPAPNQEESSNHPAVPPQDRSTEEPNLEKKTSINEELPVLAPEDEENDDQGQKMQNQRPTPTKSLQEVLDGYLKHNSWILDSAQVEREIEEIKASMRKNESALDSGNISLREDVWLSFPKAWSSSCCTFLAPTDVHELKSLSPLEYLRKYVHISQRRKHLYGLVFERYRTMENPLGRHISAQVGLKAVAEVLGEALSPDDARDLIENLLDIQSPEFQLDQDTFGGVCAACERIYGKYPLEEGAEFARKSVGVGRARSNVNNNNSSNKNVSTKEGAKEVNQPSHLESADFEYLSAKVMGNDVEEHLAQLLNAICRRRKASASVVGEAA